MMSSPGNLYVRASYLAVAICAPIIAAVPAALEVIATFALRGKEWPVISVTYVFLFCLFLFPGLRAIRRLFRDGAVIQPELVSERPVVSFVVTLFGGFGHFWFVITMSAAIGIALAPEWPEEAKKIAGPLLLGLLSYFIALMCGELALVGTGESDKARASRSAAL